MGQHASRVRVVPSTNSRAENDSKQANGNTTDRDEEQNGVYQVDRRQVIIVIGHANLSHRPPVPDCPSVQSWAWNALCAIRGTGASGATAPSRRDIGKCFLQFVHSYIITFPNNVACGVNLLSPIALLVNLRAVSTL